ncbi:DUF2730 family protein [Mesorhizobium sp. 2RAF21]|uniref:DUF2730 family protein n=1 Tax=Mesorhizobium sp. 2RAF21 TaxID=3232995 RepID=UPI003F98D8EE
MVELLAPWISLALSVIALMTIVYRWFTSGEKKNAEDLTDHRDKVSKSLEAVGQSIAAHDRRIQAVEADLKHLPDKDSVNELKLTMAKLEGTVGRLDESLSSVQRTVLRIDDWLRTDRK